MENKDNKKEEEEKCTVCGGKGWITEPVQGDPFMADCYACNGTGKKKQQKSG